MATLCANLKQLALPLALSMFLCAATSQVPAQASVEGEKLAVLPAAVDAAIAPAALTTEDLERRFYAKTYEGESAQKRLARLEISVFGELRQGRPESDRLHDLNNAVLEKERAALTAGAVGAAKLATRKPEGGKKKETYLTWYRKAGADIRLKRYHAAADELLEAIKLNPRFPNAYAYMGDVLLKLKDREGAKEAYKACFEVDPAGRYGRYGRAKLLGLAHQEAYQRTAPQDSPKVVERTINTINRQSNDLASRYQLEYHHSSLWKNTLASIAQRRLLEAANANHAARFTPLLLLLFAVYLVATGRRARLWDEGRALWFVAGAAVVVAPLAVVLLRDPALLFGRAGQVSILSPEVSGGDPLGALLGNTGRALGLYLWRGDPILRHNALLSYDAVLKSDNPAGRPAFDLLMAGPFLVGLGWCLWRWRRPAAAFLLLWQLVMLGPTLLAEDAPHFLRAAGILPGAVFFPAIGLAQLWAWPRLPAVVRRLAVVGLLAGSLALTIRDYRTYARQPDVAYLWESAAAELAGAARAAPEGTTVLIDRRFTEGWPSVPFLLHGRAFTPFDPAEPLPALAGPTTVFAWPYGALDFLPAAVTPPALVTVEPGPLARGDLEPEPYSLYTRYDILPGPAEAPPAANFDDRYGLRATATLAAPDALTVALEWTPGAAHAAGDAPPQVFVHVLGPEGMLAQYDGAIGGGLWPAAGWQPLLRIGERHTLALPRPFQPAQDRIEIGLYDPATGQRLPLIGAGGDVFVLTPGG